jgi:hypothetical protein
MNASKNSAPIKLERWTTLSVTPVTLPPIFSPDLKCNSTALPGAALKETEDGGIWLQGALFLSEQKGTGNRRDDDSDNK